MHRQFGQEKVVDKEIKTAHNIGLSTILAEGINSDLFYHYSSPVGQTQNQDTF